MRKPHPPGAHGGKRRKLTEYALQLLEKQKMRFTYGLSDKQLKDIFKYATAQEEETPKVVMAELERRLDNVVHRLGFVPSRSASRKMVSHGHFTVNGRKVNIPSFKVSPGDVIGIREQSRGAVNVASLKETIKEHNAPSWLELDKEKLEGKVVSEPHDIDTPFDIGLVVDYYLR